MIKFHKFRHFRKKTKIVIKKHKKITNFGRKNTIKLQIKNFFHLIFRGERNENFQNYAFREHHNQMSNLQIKMIRRIIRKMGLIALHITELKQF